jgi:hypothetical protein
MQVSNFPMGPWTWFNLGNKAIGPVNVESLCQV